LKDYRGDKAALPKRLELLLLDSSQIQHSWGTLPSLGGFPKHLGGVWDGVPLPQWLFRSQLKVSSGGG